MIYSTDFETFWRAYPKKKDKGYCFKKWVALKKKNDLPELKTILTAITDQKKERTFLKHQNKFIPEWKHASTWLNRSCWEDECELALQVTRTKSNEIQSQKSNGVDNMARAYKILRNLGEERFKQYCHAMNMPAGDIEAVIFKHSGTYSVESVESLTKGMLQGV